MSEIKTILISITSAVVSHGILAGFSKINILWKERFVTCNVLSVDDLIETPIRKIVIDTTEELLKTDDEYLQNCYLKLLKTAYHKDKQNIAHPAFSTILSQLSRDEAMMLCRFREDRHNIETLSKAVDLFFQENLVLYLSHLVNMDLLMDAFKTSNSDNARMVVGGGGPIDWYTLTDFGKLFVQACIPDDIDIKQLDYLRKYQPK